MFQPYLVCEWASNYYQARIKRLIVLQNRAIRIRPIIGCFNVSCSTASSYKQLRILKIGQKLPHSKLMNLHVNIIITYYQLFFLETTVCYYYGPITSSKPLQPPIIQ